MAPVPQAPGLGTANRYWWYVLDFRLLSTDAVALCSEILGTMAVGVRVPVPAPVADIASSILLLSNIFAACTL
jgi:hypothetical protein